MRVVVAEAVAPVRERLEQLVREQPGFELVGLAGELDELLERVRTTRPQLLILGTRLADATSFEALRRLAHDITEVCAVLLCPRLDGQYLFRARTMGVDYVLESPRDLEILPTLMRQLAKAGTCGERTLPLQQRETGT